MADETSAEETLSRAAVAQRLRTLADEFDGDGEIDVTIGNKDVTLQPSPELTYASEVAERDGTVRSDKQSLALDINWTPEDE